MREPVPTAPSAPAALLAGLLAWVVTAAAAPPAAKGEPASYGEGRERFVAAMVQEHGLDRAELSALLGRARFRSGVVAAMERPYEAQPWHRYRQHFLTPERIEGGVRYWRRHGAALERAAARYGVGPEILVAILGVETSYGEQLGGYLALDALTTLGFSYPKRAGFFQDELKSLLLLAREGSVDPLKARGSYAGALGKPQFIPSSYRDYAVDFDGDGRRDLWGSDADILGSVANYFVRHGWRPGEPIAVPVRFPGGPAQGVPVGLKLAGREPQVPNLTAAELRGLGAEIETDLAPDTGLALIRLDGPDGGCCDEYWAGLANFYAITRYNRSNLYAMAVYQLSREILARRDGGA